MTQAKVPSGGTQLCRFQELNDGLDIELKRLMHAAVVYIEGLIFVDRTSNVSSVQWLDDRLGAYSIGSGLRHEPSQPEENLKGFLWLHYLSDGPLGLDESPLDIEIPAELARDAAYRVELIIAATKAHHRLMRTRGLLTV